MCLPWHCHRFYLTWDSPHGLLIVFGGRPAWANYNRVTSCLGALINGMPTSGFHILAILVVVHVNVGHSYTFDRNLVCNGLGDKCLPWLLDDVPG